MVDAFADTVLAVAASVTVDGTELDEEMRAHLEQVVVDDDVSLPAMCAVTLQDPELDIIARSGLRIGAKVEIGYAGQGGADDPIFTGEVVTIECDYDAFGKRVVVRGYAASHRLHSGRRTRAFSNVTDSDIVNQVAEDAGIEVGAVQETDEVHDHVTQANVSDWEFLTTRARAIGYDLSVEDGKLTFGKSTAAASAPADSEIDSSPEGRDERVLVYGENLLAFHGRISGAEQVASVEVRGWDDTQKTPIVATADAGTEAAKLDLADPANLAGLFGSPKLVAVDESITTDGAANTAAKALGERIGSAFAKADGVAIGNAKLRAGTPVRIGRLSDDFNGAYVLTQVRHVIDGFGYRTSFTIGGRQAPAGPDTAAGVSSDGGSVHRLPGVVRAIVEDNNDPDSAGRVKVSYPWLDEDYKSDWAPVVQLGAGPTSGTFFLPAVKDEVLVGFEQGNVGRPIVLGGLFNGQDTPPTYSQWLDNGAVNGRGIYSRSGHMLELWDDSDHDMAVLSTAGAAESVALIHKDQKIVVQSDGAIEITAQGELKIHAAKITLEADGQFVLKGAQISLN